MDTSNLNYYIKDRLAYTEDDVLVYNIFIHKIHRKLKRLDIVRYFSQFGIVEHVQLMFAHTRARHSVPKIGFVYFADPYVAARVLQIPKLWIEDVCIRVKACDSWHQPMPKLDPDVGSIDGSVGAMGELNDDCLELICKKLELVDQISFASCCGRFKYIFKMATKIMYKKCPLYLLKGLTLWKKRIFLKILGNDIEEVTGFISYKDRLRVVEFIGNFCPNLKRIVLQNTILNKISFRKLFHKVRKVTELEFRECRLTDDCIHTIVPLTHLRKLSITETSGFTGKFLYKLSNLEELSLHHCSRVHTANILAICRSLINLRTLVLNQCGRLSLNAYKELSRNCTNIEILKISVDNTADLSPVADLPKLKHLEIFYSWEMHGEFRSSFFSKLIRMAETLEHLKIYAKHCIELEHTTHLGRMTALRQLYCSHNEGFGDGCLQKLETLQNLEVLDVSYCKNITNNGILRLLRRCLNLQQINMIGCDKLNEVLVYDAINVLEKRRGSLRQPVRWLLCRSGIPSYVTEDERYLAAKDLLELNYLLVPISTPFTYTEVNIEDEDDVHSQNSDEMSWTDY